MAWLKDKKLTKKERMYVDMVAFTGYVMILTTSFIYITQKVKKMKELPDEQLNGVA